MSTVAVKRMSQEEVDRIALEAIQKLQALYEPGRDRVVTPDNVYQPAVVQGREILEALQLKLILDGSCVNGTDHLDHCLGELERGRTVLFLSDHRSNLDAPAFNSMVRRIDPRYEKILDKLIYVAGRKLNESSEFIKMFTEKYARLIIVPKRDFPPEQPGASESESTARAELEQEAARINRAAFRQLVRLKKAGHIFLLFPLGGRWKPDASNEPVPETVSYIRAFDTIYLIGMTGSTLPVRERMEEERPVQDTITFHIGAPLDSKEFLALQRSRYDGRVRSGSLSAENSFEQFTVEQVMIMLGNLRLGKDYGEPLTPGS